MEEAFRDSCSYKKVSRNRPVREVLLQNLFWSPTAALFLFVQGISSAYYRGTLDMVRQMVLWVRGRRGAFILIHTAFRGAMTVQLA